MKVHIQYPSTFRHWLLLSRWEVHCMLWGYWSLPDSLPSKYKKCLTVIHKHKTHIKGKKVRPLAFLWSHLPSHICTAHGPTTTGSAFWIGDASEAVDFCWICMDASISQNPKRMKGGLEKTQVIFGWNYLVSKLHWRGVQREQSKICYLEAES